MRPAVPHRHSKDRLLSLRPLALVAMALQLLVSGCASPSRLAAVPVTQTVQAQTAIPNARFFPDRNDPEFLREAQRSYDKELAWLASSGHTGPLPPVAYLTIPWGGGDGAFAAGRINGSTAAGNGPDFEL